nr:hypothetical protein [Microbacterium sp. NIBRBAC000506063]
MPRVRSSRGALSVLSGRRRPAAVRRRAFIQVLVNTAIANVTTSYLWFALTFWVYIETRSVLATGIIGGAYMLFVSIFAMVFGTIVDRHRKHTVMVGSSLVSAAAFLAAAGCTCGTRSPRC